MHNGCRGLAACGRYHGAQRGRPAHPGHAM